MIEFDRRAAILRDLDVGRLRGLEIGPLHNPMVRKSDGDVLYVDHADTESIKRAVRNPDIDIGQIVDIDIIWGDRPLKELVPEPMDYAVASHVIEHVPDMVGWLLDLHGALKEDGLICLAIPDRRFTYDFRRPETAIGELVEAYLMRARRPPARHLFDKWALQTVFPKAEGWENDILAQVPPQGPDRLAEAYRVAQDVATRSVYVDVHCWVFTPESFLDIAERLSLIGLFPFAVEHFHPTEYGDYEFYTRLRKSQDAAAIAASIERARDRLKDAPTEQAYREMLIEKIHGQALPEPSCRRAISELAAEKGQLAAEMRQLAAERHRLYYEAAHERERLAREQRRLDNDFRYVHAWAEQIKNSTSWRLTRPVRWLGRMIKGK